MNPTAPLTKKDFWATYWFSPMQMVTLTNPKVTDYLFMVEERHFIIRAGATESMPGTVANIYLSQMTRILAQDENRMEFLSDLNLMKIYYDKLIVDVKSLMPEYNVQPAYLSHVPEHMKAAAPEVPPWQTAPKSTIPETNSAMTNTWEAPKAATPPQAEEPAKAVPAKEQTKEFEFEGVKYKMVVDKNDKEVFFKNGSRINAAEYSRIASML